MFDANNEPRHKHPFYRLFLMTEAEVQAELSTWPREQVIAWLKWNDPFGAYTDEESLKRFGTVMSYEEGLHIIIRQIFYNSDEHDAEKGSVREAQLQVWGNIAL